MVLTVEHPAKTLPSNLTRCSQTGGSYLVVRAVSDQWLGVQESSSGDGGSLSLSVLQKQVGTQLLPLHLPSTGDVYLHIEQFKDPYLICTLTKT